MLRGLWTLAATAATVASLAGTASPARPLETAIYPKTQTLALGDVAYARIAAAGAAKVRLVLHWRRTAPGGARPPAGFDSADPADPGYDWSEFDERVRLAAAHGLAPIATILWAPQWASGPGEGPAGSVRPDPAALARFARAAARRYSGSFQGLPRVRYWQVWNEPNHHNYLNPQLVGGKPFAATWYRRMLNAAARELRAVRADNVVVGAGMSPFEDAGSLAPLRFMRELLCISLGLPHRKTCNAKASLDVWSTHPYTWGGATNEAYRPDDVSLGDLPEVRSLLNAAWRAGRIDSRRAPQFWVTEFSWDSQPLDSNGLPLGLHARWLAEALHQMWKSGVTVVTWFLLRDERRGEGFAQSGLYINRGAIANDEAKPALTAFRFPFVAYKRGIGLTFWGRTPTSTALRVAVEQNTRSGWRRLAVLRADRYGIFQGSIARRQGNSAVRARVLEGGEMSLGFSLARPPDRRICPFGSC
jgi:hypothetical protein